MRLAESASTAVMPATSTGPACVPRVAWLANTIPDYRLPEFRCIAAAFPGTRFLVSDDPLGRNLAGATFASLAGVERIRSLWIPRRRRHPDGYLQDEHVCIPWGLAADILRGRPDVIVTGELGARSLIAAVCRRLRPAARLVLHADLSEDTERGRGGARTAFRRMLLARADIVVVNGESGERYVRALGVAAERVVRIGYSADIDQFSPVPALRPAHDVLHLLFVGQLIDRKGLVPFVDALARACAARPGRRVALRIIGSGPDGDPVTNRPMPPTLRVTVEPAVPRATLPDAYRAAHVFVLPSLAETWGLVVGEAMATGLPVLGSSRAQAVTTMVEHGRSGWVYDPRDPGAAADACIRLLDADEPTLLASGRAAREAAAAHAPAVIAARWRTVLERAAAIAT